MGVCWLFLVIFCKNVFIEKYEFKLDLTSQKARNKGTAKREVF